MTDRLRSARLKIERARKHIGELDALICGFCDSHPYEILATPHRVPAIQHTTLYVGQVQPVTAEIPLAVGDSIHNLRSALDHVAYHLVTEHDRRSARVYFPIFDPFKEFESAANERKMKGMTKEAQKLVRGVQPHNTSDNTLWQIHKLDILDKHRLLIVTSLAFTGWEVEVVHGQRLHFDKGWTFRLEEGEEITNLPTSTYKRKKHEDFGLRLEVIFDEPEIIENKPILETLNRMTDYVENLINKFEEILP